MSNKRTIRLALIVACALIALLISSAPAMAQCAMCKNAITGSPNAARLAERFNFAIFVLLIPPVLIFCGFFIAVFKYRKEQGEAPEHGTKRLLRVLRLR
jgi:heme/copper-type cytochrome/quinol oxidase subunit 2